MGPTALSYLSTATGNPQYLNTATKLWWKTTDYLYDPAEHLYFRDGKLPGIKKEKNGKKIFGRGVMGGSGRIGKGNGKHAANYPDKKKFEKLYRDMAAKIALTANNPMAAGTPPCLIRESYPVKETSGTGFYCYALLWDLTTVYWITKRTGP